MEKKAITIGFESCPDNWNKKNNYIVDILSKHYQVSISDRPQYLFYSDFSFSKYPKQLDYDCIKIYFTGESIFPDFNLCDYAWAFDYLEFGDRYLRFPNYAVEFYHKHENEAMLKKHLSAEAIFDKKERFCSFVYSNKAADPFRDYLFRELSKYRKVDSGGRWLNNIGKKDGVKDKVEFEKIHKFSIACENSSHAGYTTEKLVQAFAAGTIPIYWGDPEIGRMFNEDAFINVNSYNSIREAIDRVKEIDNDDEQYLIILKQPAVTNSKNLYTNYNNELEKFLIHIINQPYKEAFRRNRVAMGKVYLNNCRNKEIRAEKYRKYERIVNNAKQILGGKGI